MTVSLWRLASDAPDYEANDLSGAGAEKSGGRWNRPGQPAVYTSSTIALACLETLVNHNFSDLALNRFLVRLDVPDEVWADREERDVATLPVGWSAVSEGKVSLDIGDVWLAGGSSALLLVPSVVVPEESSVMVNPKHPKAVRIRALKVRGWFYDGRLAIGPART